MKKKLRITVLSIFVLKVVKEVTGRNEFTGRCLLSAVEARGQGGVHEGLLGWQEEVASCLLAPSSCRHPCALKHVSLSTGFSSCSFSFPTDLGEEDKRQHQDEDLFGPASAWALCDPPEVSGLMFSSILLPSTPFLEWFLVLSCFLNRKFLTWEWLLGLGRRRTLWWIPQGTLVASPIPPCIVLSLRQLLLVVRHPETVVRSGALGVGFTDFFFFGLCFVFCFFSFKAFSKFEERALSIICRPFFHGEEQEGVPSAMRFHLLNPISGSRRSLPCQAQFTASSEAWGRGPSRRAILRTRSLLGEMNVLCYVWCVPSIPPAERQKSLRERQRALQ